MLTSCPEETRTIPLIKRTEIRRSTQARKAPGLGVGKQRREQTSSYARGLNACRQSVR